MSLLYFRDICNSSRGVFYISEILLTRLGEFCTHHLCWRLTIFLQTITEWTSQTHDILVGTHKNKDIWYLQISLALIISVNFSASYRDYIYIYQTYSWTTLKKGQLYQNDWWNSRHIYLVYVWKQKHLMSVYNRTQIHIHKITRGSVGWACVAHLSFCFEET